MIWQVLSCLDHGRTIFRKGQTGTLVNRKNTVPKKECSLKKRSSLRIILGFYDFAPKKEVFSKKRSSFRIFPRYYDFYL